LNSHYQRILLRRTFGFWLVLRLLWLVLLTAALLTGAVMVTIRPTPFDSAILLGVAGWLVLYDARVAGEDVLLANLGVSRLRVALPVFALTLALEVLLLGSWTLLL
jgi:hypothetical protein